MIAIRNVLTITKKELKSFFDSPTAYIVLAVFLLLWEFLFFRNAFLVGEASLRGLFDYLPWLFLVLIPAITMGSLAEEYSEGTLEFLLTHPLKDIELLIGKFLGSLAFAAIALLFIVPIAIGFAQYGNLDWGVVAGQYLGSVLSAGVLIALGVFISSLVKNQIAALLTTAVSGFFLIISGFEFFTASVPLRLVPVFEQMSVTSHVQSMARGVIDLRDLWYFLSAVAVFLSLAFLQLLKRRFGNRKSLYRSYKIGMSLFIGIAVLVNVAGQKIPGRIDITQERQFTLSDGTKKVLSNLNDVVNLTLYSSAELPSQLQPVLRTAKDTMRDYQNAGKGKIVVSYKNPSSDQQAANEALQAGVQEVQFNVVGNESFQVKKGFLGAAVSYGGKNEALPFIQDISELEYQLTSAIAKLTTKDKKKIVFLSGHGEKTPTADYRYLNSELAKQFEVQSFAFDATNTKLPENTAVLVVAGPNQKIDEPARASIKDFLGKGGSAMFLIDAMAVNQQSLSAAPNAESFADFLSDYGVEVKQNVVYDLRSNETVSFGGGPFGYTLPYPFWARVQAVNSGSPVTAKIESMVLPWASSLGLDENKARDKGFSISKLLATTKYAGVKADSVSISPDQEFTQTGLGEQVMTASLEGLGGQDNKKARIVVVGNSMFISDQFVQNAPENLAFGIQSISWLSQEESLAGIRLKQKAERRLLFENQTQISLVKYGNMALAVLLPIAFGAYRLLRRRNLRKLTYTSAYEQ